MTGWKLLTEFASLPAELKKEVQDFVAALRKSKKWKRPKQQKFGAAKGFFVVGKDFDEPWEGFKECV